MTFIKFQNYSRISSRISFRTDEKKFRDFRKNPTFAFGSAFGLSHAGSPRILRTSCSCAASSKPFRKRGFSLASGGHGFCPTDGKNLSSRVCRSHTVAVGRTYALTRRWDFATIIAPIGSFFRESAGMRKCSPAAERCDVPCVIILALILASPAEIPQKNCVFLREPYRGGGRRVSVGRKGCQKAGNNPSVTS